MTRQWIKSWLQLGAVGLVVGVVAACTWRTEHKVETVHKIEAHIVLDIRQIQQDADQVEDYVRGQDEATPDILENDPTSLRLENRREVMVADAGPLDWLSLTSAAWAAEDEKEIKKVDDEMVAQALKARKERAEEVEKALAKELVGEDDRAGLSLLPAVEKLKEDEQKKLKAMVKAENADRRVVYLGTAQRAGGNEKNLPEVQKVFAKSIREKLKAGQMFRAPADKKAFEEFTDSKLGKEYPDSKPGQWLKKK